MSPDENALLNGIAADPAADLPRLVYADWLEERGQDLRAEFIRVQCEISKLEVGPRDAIDRNIHLWRRQQELLDEHMGELLEGVTYHPKACSEAGSAFRRGFVSSIDISAEELRDHVKILSGLRPTPSDVSVTAPQQFIESEHARSPAAHRLVTSLQFFGDDAGGVCYFDMNLEWPRVQSLTFNSSPEIVPVLMPLLSYFVPKLASLNLASNQINDSDVIELLNAGVLQRLSHISLIENAIGDQAALEMADRLGNSPNLKELDLRRNGITAVGQRELLARLGSKVILF